MSGVLYGMINSRAESSYTGPVIDAKNFQLWVNHWFHVAHNLADEFEKEGLVATADAIRTIIRDQGKYLNRSEKEALEKVRKHD